MPVATYCILGNFDVANPDLEHFDKINFAFPLLKFLIAINNLVKNMALNKTEDVWLCETSLIPTLHA